MGAKPHGPIQAGCRRDTTPVVLRKLSFAVLIACAVMWLAGETPRSLKERLAAEWHYAASVGIARYATGDWGGAG